MALTIEEQLRQGLFSETPIGRRAPLSVASDALSGMDDEYLTERELELLEWGATFGAAFAIARQEDPWESTESVASRAVEPARLVWHRVNGVMPSRGREEEPVTGVG